MPTSQPLFNWFMNFKQRLLRYLVGFSIGVVIVFMMFPQYDWLSWVPNKQVMQRVREYPFFIDQVAKCKNECLGIDSLTLQTARIEGRIDFSMSDVKRSPKTYYMEHNEIGYTLQLTDTTVTLIDAMKVDVECDCR
jgi:hypothetical protein